MSFSKLALASVFLFSIYAVADDTDVGSNAPDSFKAVNDAAESRARKIDEKYNKATGLGYDDPTYQDLSKTYLKLKSAYSTLETNVATQEKKQKDAIAQDEKDRKSGFLSFSVGSVRVNQKDGTPADKAAINTETAKLNNLNTQLATAKDQLFDAQRRLYSANSDMHDAAKTRSTETNALSSDKGKALSDINAEVKKLKNYLNGEEAWNQLREDYSDLELKSLRVSDVLHQIDARYDKTILGAYMASKIEKLMTSDAFCHVAKACDSSAQKNTYQLNRKDMEQIFSGSPGYLPPAENKTIPSSSGGQTK